MLGNLMGCVTPFDAETTDFESVLVVDAVLTNEVKQHQIFLSRTYRFEDSIINESSATVKVIEGDLTEYDFFESTPGTYVSNSSFAARPNTNYQLVITTPDGKRYSSDIEVVTNEVPFDDLYAAITTNDLNEEGISILIDNVGAENNSGYYRFEYEETYKIVAPLWDPMDVVVISDSPPTFDFITKTQEEQVCYNTEPSLNLILANTNRFSENKLNRYPVRFLNKDNFIISHRYSILVKQYSISREAHTFYETLNEFSGVESVFSENQPGFFNGNINTDSNEKVIGFFDVATVSSKRIFFNYKDFYPDSGVANFPDKCMITIPIKERLVSAVQNDRLKFLLLNPDPDPSVGPYLMVPRICGDCTVLGSNIIPEFWVE